MIDILMPRLSDTMTEGAIATWHKQPGDQVSPGDLLLDIETDKALMEQEAYDAGTLVEILVAAGERAEIGTPIARLDDGVEHVPEPARGPEPALAQTTEPAAAQTTEPAAAQPTEPAASAPVVPSTVAPERRIATPLVRRLAKERGVDLATVAGSGPGGRIVRADLDALPTPSPEPDTDTSDAVPFDPIRRVIATRLSESAATTPVFHATASADVTALLALRAQVNDAGAEQRVSVNDFVVKAVALALKSHPGMNASYSATNGGQTVLHRDINVGIAVAAPAGLVVPVVAGADHLSITAIASRTRSLAQRAADRTLTAAEMSGGTFTVSNLGMFGVEQFTAIINPPQGAILAVGAITHELALEDGTVVDRSRLRYTVTSDHRIIDGADAGRFLATLTALLENPLRLLM